jgi:uncharacterized YkwD family protein/spore coat assembly protein SafA
MKKLLSIILCTAICLTFIFIPVNAGGGSTSYTVIRGDCMWKIAVKYKVGTSEIISANPQVKNPDMIYPGEVLNIPSVDASVLAYETDVITLINKIRSDNGLSQFKTNWELSRVARIKAKDMHDKGYFDHTSPTYGSPFAMMKSFGISYSSAAENIAMGYSTPQQVVNGWMGSPGHRANILNPSYTQIGVGYCADGNYWSQMFIG